VLQVSELVSLAQQGDSTAFATLYEGYRPTIYRFLRRRLDRSNQAVEDLTEDVFVKVFERLDRYEERGLPFTAWLYRIARNHVVDCLRAQRRTACQSLESSEARWSATPVASLTAYSTERRSSQRWLA